MSSTKKGKTILLINDIVWFIMAILCIKYDNGYFLFISISTTIIYIIDLVLTFKKMDCNFKLFFKKHWLDVFFLIPFCKLFRSIRIIKVGKLLKGLRVADASIDASECIFRFIKFIKRNEKY